MSPPLFLLFLLFSSSHGVFSVSLYKAGNAHFSTPTNASTPSSSSNSSPSSAFWLSDNGNLTFGFKTLDPNQYLLCIWLTADADRTPLWWPNLTNPVITQEAAALSFTSHGNLELSVPNQSILWHAPVSNASFAKLQNTGNLQLLDGTMEKILWQSFSDLRDTLIVKPRDEHPADPFSSIVTGKPHLLRSRLNGSSYASGRFHVTTDANQTAYLYARDTAYNVDFFYLYAQMTVTEDSFQLTTDGGTIFDEHSHLPIIMLRLDTDGNLGSYGWDASLSMWSTMQKMINNKCLLASPCGPYGICNPDTNGSFHCTCPVGYHAVDKQSHSLGCRTNFSLSSICENGSGSHSSNGSLAMVENSQGIDYYYNDFNYKGYNTTNIEECKQLCLNTCDCIAVSYLINQATCFLKGNSSTWLLMNGYSTGGNTVFMKLLIPTASSTGNRKIGAVTGAVVAVAIVGLLLGIALVIWGYKRKLREVEYATVLGDSGPFRFTYQQLVKATHNFSELLGEGGFGKVYKGTIVVVVEKGKKQQIPVAVKVLKSSTGAKHDEEAEKQFRAEVSTLGKIHHINLVDLWGYCIGDRAPKKRILVYEYIENGSLAEYLSRRANQPPSWEIRCSIALGMARGISYLHHDCHPHIFHCDIKPQNVLLDRDFTPKVSDFGLARRLEEVKTHLTMSGIRGTRGYMAPEWVKTDEITSKADVYSYGMVLLELIRGFHATEDDDELIVDWAYQFLRNGGEEVVQNRSESDNVSESSEKMRLVKIGLWCVQNQPHARPSMSQIVKLIEGKRDDIEIPPYPASRVTFVEGTSDEIGLPPYPSSSVEFKETDRSSNTPANINSHVSDSYSTLSAR